MFKLSEGLFFVDLHKYINSTKTQILRTLQQIWKQQFYGSYIIYHEDVRFATICKNIILYNKQGQVFYIKHFLYTLLYFFVILYKSESINIIEISTFSPYVLFIYILIYICPFPLFVYPNMFLSTFVYFQNRKYFTIKYSHFNELLASEMYEKKIDDLVFISNKKSLSPQNLNNRRDMFPISHLCGFSTCCTCFCFQKPCAHAHRFPLQEKNC